MHTDPISEAAVEELIGELQELFARHNAGAALTAKAVFKPSKDFHTARHTLFTPEQNLEIDKVVPVSASVKTKLGRGGGEAEVGLDGVIEAFRKPQVEGRVPCKHSVAEKNLPWTLCRREKKTKKAFDKKESRNDLLKSCAASYHSWQPFASRTRPPIPERTAGS
jgi:hypothetical protein